MLKISKEANPNYLSKIVQLKGIRPHSNADKLKLVDIDFQTVIVGLDAQEGDVYVYFPVESQINKDFLSFTNSFRDKELNQDEKKAGFFEDNCRVKAVRLRNEKSEGYLVPIAQLEEFLGVSGLVQYVGQEFDTINGVKLVKKYEIIRRNTEGSKGKKQAKKLNRLVDNQVFLHLDTHKLVNNVHKLELSDVITITYKLHGSSGWTSNVLVKKQLGWRERVLKKLGVNIVDTEYDVVFGSRRVIKNRHLKDPKQSDHYYGVDLWGHVVEENNLRDILPKGYTMYYEIVGHTPLGSPIQGGYHYGYKGKEHGIYVYRMTYVNPDGFVTELSTLEIKEFCVRVGLNTVPIIYHGTIQDYLGVVTEYYTSENWRDIFMENLKANYTNQFCYMHPGEPVHAEGIVLKKESLFNFEAFKLKCFNFLMKESKQLDSGEIDIESEN